MLNQTRAWQRSRLGLCTQKANYESTKGESTKEETGLPFVLSPFVLS
jgi:hypothetical protein